MVDLLVGVRALQLEKQLQLDKKLSICPCTDTVSEYLLHRRLVNREQYKFVQSGGTMNAYQNIQTNLKEIDTDNNRMEVILSGPDPCGDLKKYLLENK